MNNKYRLRPADINEASLLNTIAARSKAHWPYDLAYLDLCNQVTRITPNEIRDWHFTVAEMDERVLGCCAVASVKNEFVIDHLWLEPDAIGLKLGKALFEDAIIKARTMGWTKLLIVSDPYAEAFYLKMGAVRIGERESKVRNNFFLPLMEYDLGLTLIGDSKIKAVPIDDCGEALVDLALDFSDLNIDFERFHVQKESQSISLARKSVGDRLRVAQGLLPTHLRLLIKECHRPRWVQKKFWDVYFDFLQKKYPNWSQAEIYDECSKLNAPLDVAPHTTGGAVDLTLTETNGIPLDMGTEFNASPLSSHRATYTAAQNISDAAKQNRQILFRCMSKAGFVNYPTERWHWSYGDKYWAYVTKTPAAIYSSVEVE